MTTIVVVAVVAVGGGSLSVFILNFDTCSVIHTMLIHDARVGCDLQYRRR